MMQQNMNHEATKAQRKKALSGFVSSWFPLPTFSLHALVPLWFLLLSSAFAQSDPEAIKKFESFLQNDTQWRISVMSNMATRLDLNDRKIMYQRYKKDALGPFFLNLLPFGIGSFVQGDSFSGTIIVIADITGGFMLFSGWIGNNNINYSQNPALFNLCNGLLVFSFPVFGLILLYECIAPWVHAGSYNDMLERALLLKDAPQASVPVLPMVAYVEGKDFSLGLGMRF